MTRLRPYVVQLWNAEDNAPGREVTIMATSATHAKARAIDQWDFYDFATIKGEKTR